MKRREKLSARLGDTFSFAPAELDLGADPSTFVVRRYNGSGVDSYHYQFQVLQRLTRPPVSA